MNENTLIEIRHLNAFYDQHQTALKEVNLSIPRRQVTVIMGPQAVARRRFLKRSTAFWN